MILSTSVTIRIVLLGGPCFGQRIAQIATSIGRPLRQGGAASIILRLEEQKHIEFSHKEHTGKQPRVYYRLTSKGRKLAEKELATLQQMTKGLTKIASGRRSATDSWPCTMRRNDCRT